MEDFHERPQVHFITTFDRPEERHAFGFLEVRKGLETRLDFCRTFSNCTDRNRIAKRASTFPQLDFGTVGENLDRLGIELFHRGEPTLCVELVPPSCVFVGVWGEGRRRRPEAPNAQLRHGTYLCGEGRGIT